MAKQVNSRFAFPSHRRAATRFFLLRRLRRCGAGAFASRQFVPRRDQTRLARATTDRLSAPARTPGGRACGAAAAEEPAPSAPRRRRVRRCAARGSQPGRREGRPRVREERSSTDPRLALVRGARARTWKERARARRLEGVTRRSRAVRRRARRVQRLDSALGGGGVVGARTALGTRIGALARLYVRL